MTCLWVGVVFALLYCAMRGSRRRYKEQLASASGDNRRPHRRHRVGDRRRRKLAGDQARNLLATLASGRHEPGARPTIGVALLGDETVYGQATARLETWSTTTTWVTDSRASWWGHRARSVTRELTAGGWHDRGEFTWILTSARAVGRSVRSGELVSISWASLAAVDVDARRESVLVDTANGWSGRLSGPGILPIVVMVVASWPQARGVAGRSRADRRQADRAVLGTWGQGSPPEAQRARPWAPQVMAVFSSPRSSRARARDVTIPTTPAETGNNEEQRAVATGSLR